MPTPQIAPYGSWRSPITSDLIVASSIGLGGILLDGTDVFWLESRPQEQGRSVIVRRTSLRRLTRARRRGNRVHPRDSRHRRTRVTIAKPSNSEGRRVYRPS